MVLVGKMEVALLHDHMMMGSLQKTLGAPRCRRGRGGEHPATQSRVKRHKSRRRCNAQPECHTEVGVTVQVYCRAPGQTQRAQEEQERRRIDSIKIQCVAFITAVNTAHRLSHPLLQITTTEDASNEKGRRIDEKRNRSCR